MDIESIKKKIKQKNNTNIEEQKSRKYLKGLLYRSLFSFLITITLLILCKVSSKYKFFIKTNVYEKKISLAYINNLYNKYLGSVIPFKDIKLFNDETKQTFNEKLEYSNLSIYKDGINLDVADNYLVPSTESGLVLFVGEKEGYGKCVVVDQINSVDLWYCNLSVVNVKVYDYIKKGSLIGEVNNNLYLVYQKDGNIVNYKDYFEENKF